MAPSVRARRMSGQTRADAALDAMRAYGFGERLIRETLKELLMVYGGGGWFLIEDDSYKVLLEAILEKVEKIEEEKKKKKENKDGNAEGVGNSTHHGDIDQSTCSNEVTERGIQPDKHNMEIDAASATDEMVVNSPPEHNSVGGLVIADAPEVKENSDGKETKLTIRPDNEHGTPSRRRKPCYGWISSEEEDEDDYCVRLTPMPLPENLKRLLLASNSHRKRKTMFDVSPDEFSTTQ